MRRTRLYQILICLLCLFPVWSQAQSLSQYEYWFDDNFSARKSAGLSGYEADIDVGIDASRLGNGLHKLCLRVQQSDGMYSPITTHYFFKAQVSNGGKLEYWFDGNRKQINTVDCHVSSDGEAYLYTSGLDLTAITPGYHTMYYRFVNDDGTTSSAVSMASIIVTSNLSNGGKLEYWFDDDRANVNMIDGKVASTGDALIFNSDLDLKDVSQGMHRMYYRLVDAKGKPNSAVSMTPVMVKSKYNVDAADLKMTKYSIAVDDEESALFSFSHPGTDVVLERKYDGRYLTKGNHQIKLKMSNSLGGSVSLQQDFTVEERPAEPVVTLAAEEKNGVVNIRFNSVPSDNGYSIYRVYANGSSKLIKNEKVSKYPTEIYYTDNPTTGTYTYYAECPYTDIDGKNKEVRSNEVSVTLTKPQTELGYVEGEIYYDGKRKVGFKSNIKFRAYNEEFIVQSNSDGVFRKDKIPVGTELMVSLAENDYYTAGLVSITVAKGRNHVIINVTPQSGCPVNDHIGYSNLTYYDRLTWEPGVYFKLPLINTSHEAWYGKICIKAYPKRYDSEEEESNVITPGAQVLPGSVASFQPLPFFETKNYQTFESDNFQLVYNQSEEVLVPMTGLTNEGSTELFNFYIYCVKPDGTMSLVEPNTSFASTSNNPLEYMIEGGMGSEEMTEGKVAYYTNLIVYYCGLVKDVDKIIGKSRDVLGYGKKKLEDDFWKLTQATDENALESEGMQEVVYDMILKCDEYSGEVKSFREKIKPIVKECGSIKTLWGYVTKTIDAVDKFSKDIASKNDYEKAIYLSQKIINLVDGSNTFSPILMKYLDITQKTIDNVLALGWAYNEPLLPLDMYNNKLKIKIIINDEDGWARSCGGLIDYVLVKGFNKDEKDVVEARFENKAGNLLDMMAKASVFVQKDTDDRSKLDESTSFKQLWAEIYWRNGRVSCVPLTEIGKGVSYEHAEENNSIFTITFDSDSDEYEHLADVIHLKE